MICEDEDENDDEHNKGTEKVTFADEDSDPSCPNVLGDQEPLDLRNPKQATLQQARLPSTTKARILTLTITFTLIMTIVGGWIAIQEGSYFSSPGCLA